MPHFPTGPTADGLDAASATYQAQMQSLKRVAAQGGLQMVSNRFAMYRGDAGERHRFRIDSFRAFVQSGIGQYTNHLGRPVIEQVVNKNDPLQRAAQSRLLDLIDKYLRVIAISPELLQAAMEAADRAMRENVDPPPWPVLPLWVEWPGAYLGDAPNEPSGFTICAVMVAPELARQRIKETKETRDIEVIRCTLIGLDNTQKALLFLPDGSWATEQMGPCLTQWCTVAHKTQPGQLYWTTQHSLQATEAGCLCWRGGYSYARILWAMMHLISAKGLIETTIDRAEQLPPKPRSPKQMRAWQNAVNSVQARNRALPRVRYLSWEDTQYGDHARVERDADGKRVLLFEEPQERVPATPTNAHLSGGDVRDDVVRRAHPRLLIADGKRPWNPPTRVVAVRRSKPYSMRVRHKSLLPPVRLVIEGGPPREIRENREEVAAHATTSPATEGTQRGDSGVRGPDTATES